MRSLGGPAGPATPVQQSFCPGHCPYFLSIMAHTPTWVPHWALGRRHCVPCESALHAEPGTHRFVSGPCSAQVRVSRLDLGGRMQRAWWARTPPARHSRVSRLLTRALGTHSWFVLIFGRCAWLDARLGCRFSGSCGVGWIASCCGLAMSTCADDSGAIGSRVIISMDSAQYLPMGCISFDCVAHASHRC